MNSFTIVFLCIQACLVQNVFSQCTSRAAVAADPGLIAPGLAVPYGLGAPFAYDGLPGWGGIAPNAGPFGYRAGIPEFGYPAGAGYAIAPYGGVGEGNVAVAGELPVVGNTLVAGQVPIMGAVNFGGSVPAAGAVSINGQCACGCGAPYEYFY